MLHIICSVNTLSIWLDLILLIQFCCFIPCRMRCLVCWVSKLRICMCLLADSKWNWVMTILNMFLLWVHRLLEVIKWKFTCKVGSLQMGTKTLKINIEINFFFDKSKIECFHFYKSGPFLPRCYMKLPNDKEEKSNLIENKDIKTFNGNPCRGKILR